MFCGYLLEAPQWGASNKYPQNMFLWRTGKINHPILLLNYSSDPHKYKLAAVKAGWEIIIAWHKMEKTI